jgi:hypothetical protein
MARVGRIRLRTALALFALTVASTLATVSVSSAAQAHCSGHAVADYDGYTGSIVYNYGIRPRNAPHQACAYSGPILKSGVNLDYYCYTIGDAVYVNGVYHTSWTYVKVVGAFVSGFINDGYLTNHGSNRLCPS